MLDKQPGRDDPAQPHLLEGRARGHPRARRHAGAHTVGHSFIKQVMAETGAVFGGEHSAHYYFRDNYRADSGLIAALIVLEQLSPAGVPLSELRKPFERYADVGRDQHRGRRPAAVIERVADALRRRRRRTASTGSPSTAATGGSTCARRTPSRCCASTSRPPTAARVRRLARRRGR